MKKIMLIFGTRPEAIKMGPLVNELKNHKNFKVITCVSGQHKEMLTPVLEKFDIIPEYNLEIMKRNQTLSEITANILYEFEKILINENPDMILVHGDTTTTYASSLAAFYHQIPVGHIEAGLRTYNITSPFPEEFNRRSVSLLANYHFAPTNSAAENLLNENINEEKIFVTGNTVIDALKTTISTEYTHPELDWAKNSDLILVTAHRRENLGEPLKNIAEAILEIVESNSNIKVIYPVHLNPKISEIINPIIGNHERIHLIKPLDVLDFHNFMNKARFIMSDSGGIQEEAPSLGKPVLVLRDTTERPEGVLANTLKLVGTNKNTIISEAQKLIDDQAHYERMAKAKNPYGDGTASKQIAKQIEQIVK